jgi:lipoprotein-anchoring transpeptidase ErfK/SrfK
MMTERRWAITVGLAIGLVFAVTAAGFLATPRPRYGSAGTSAAEKALSAAADGVPVPQQPAFVVHRPRLLSRHESVAQLATVRQAVVAREKPSATAPPVASVGLKTPEGTTNLVLVVGAAVRRDGQWVHVRLAVLPNDRTGWVRRRALGGYRFLHTNLVIDRATLTATLFYDRRPIFHAPVGIGKPQSPTPAGKFYVRDELRGFGNPFYGPIAYGTSARSPVLTDWPGGGFVGIHGTNEPGLIPGRISHGCIRLRNSDILRLSRLMPVGTPVTIE